MKHYKNITTGGNPGIAFLIPCFHRNDVAATEICKVLKFCIMTDSEKCATLFKTVLNFAKVIVINFVLQLLIFLYCKVKLWNQQAVKCNGKR